MYIDTVCIENSPVRKVLYVCSKGLDLGFLFICLFVFPLTSTSLHSAKILVIKS